MASFSRSDASKDQPAEADEADLAQAWKELQKGEKTAEALEANLTNLEKKIDDLLAGFEEGERAKLNEASGSKQLPDAVPSDGSEKDEGDRAGKS